MTGNLHGYLLRNAGSNHIADCRPSQVVKEERHAGSPTRRRPGLPEAPYRIICPVEYIRTLRKLSIANVLLDKKPLAHLAVDGKRPAFAVFGGAGVKRNAI